MSSRPKPAHMGIQPTPDARRAVARKHGPWGREPTEAEAAHLWRLAQAQTLIDAYEAGRLDDLLERAVAEQDGAKR